jgi:alpha-amylase/alpha-mannosidase (GH57 family)
MHQPHYEDPLTGEFALPWVRLHTAKDYVDMVERAAEHPGLRLTFNLVPSFLEQVDAYLGGATDTFERLARLPAESWAPSQRRFALRHFFSLNPRLGTQRWPRLAALQEIRGEDWENWSDTELDGRLDSQDFRDLATLFHLGWLDERHWDACGVRPLAERGMGFSEADKSQVLDAHRAVLARAEPAYRAALAGGQIELTCSPHYHPILPLLLEPRSAREAIPDLTLPKTPWHFPGDARKQVRSALEDMERRFGQKPHGMWPSEGSVSHATAQLLSEEGIDWAASDEGVLGRSLGLRPGDRGAVRRHLYQPYRVQCGDRSLGIFFRDQELSDRIGFAYQGMDAQDATRDFLDRLRHIAENWNGPEDPVVTVALDGENCWESYEGDGDPFLRAFYAALTETPWIRTVTPSEALSGAADPPVLERLFAGSWIHHNFRIWIGHSEDNEAWDRLAEAREALDQSETAGILPPERLAAAWNHLAVAEGSDWFWWFGDEHFSPDADIFDRLFRNRLIALWQCLGQPVPASLRIPIKHTPRGIPGFHPPEGRISPVLDGRVTHFYEWRAAGTFDPGFGGGAMHAGEPVLSRWHFGFGETEWYHRLDWNHGLVADSSDLEAVLEIWEPVRVRIKVPGPRPGAETALSMELLEAGEWRPSGDVGRGITGEVTELALSLAALGVSPGDLVRFSLQLRPQGGSEAAYPGSAPLALSVPSPGDEEDQWSAQ